MPLGKRAFSGPTSTPVPQPRDPRLPAPGTVITRSYRGRTIAVTVMEDGFEYEDRRYKSLTAVAKAVSGLHQNGFAFFQLTRKDK